MASRNNWRIGDCSRHRRGQARRSREYPALGERDRGRSDAPDNAANYFSPKVDGLIDAIHTAIVTYARDALMEEVWRMVRDDIVLVPLHQQVIVWAMRDRLDLPVDPLEPAAVPPGAAERVRRG